MATNGSRFNPVGALLQAWTNKGDPAHPKATPEIIISYAWGDNSSEISRKRGEVLERLSETLGKEGWNIIRDKNAMRSGDLISGFMKRIGLADRVIVVLSDKYLHSPYCVTELYSIYQLRDRDNIITVHESYGFLTNRFVTRI